MPCRARARLRSLLLQLGYCPWLLPRSRRRSSTATSQAPTRTTWFFSFVLFAFSLLGPPPSSSPARRGGGKEVGAGLGTRNPELGTTYQRRGSTSLPMRSRLARSSPGELSQRFLSP